MARCQCALKNPRGNPFMYNIDFHASTGGLGGGALTQVNPGEQAVLRWRATKPGTFIYHCAPSGSMIPYHVVSGMTGAFMVLPREGLSDRDERPIRYDRAYDVGEQDLYLPRDSEGNFKRHESQAAGISETLGVMRTLTPSHVVFNGSVGSLAGNQALKAKVGARRSYSSTLRPTRTRGPT